MKMYIFIEARRSQILKVCLAALRETHWGETDEEDLAGLPQFLDELVGILRRDASVGAPETVEASAVRRSVEAALAARRGVTRRTQGFPITRVVHDYGVLCDKLNEMAARENVVFASRDHQLMNICLDEAIARGIEAFTDATATEEQADRAIVLGSLAHEIRNAVNAATLAFALIRKGQVGTTGRTAEVLQQAHSRIERLVENALVEAKIHAKTPVRQEHTRLIEVLGQLADGAFPERGITVVVEVQPDLHIDVDPQLLGSAVGNLLQNAIKFTQNDGRVTLRARQTDDATIIEVEDRCGGLPQGASEALFKPFVQGRPDPRGVGLGLHVARNAVEVHGGTITATDLPDVGCIFAITLPRPMTKTTSAA